VEKIRIRNGKSSDPGFVVNIPDPQHCSQTNLFFRRWRHFTYVAFPYQWNAELTLFPLSLYIFLSLCEEVQLDSILEAVCAQFEAVVTIEKLAVSRVRQVTATITKIKGTVARDGF
jgi:hypothetical protein